MGPAAWAIALTGTRLLGDDGVRRRAAGILILTAAALALLAWGRGRPIPFFGPSAPSVWQLDRRRVFALAGFALAAIVSFLASIRYLRHPGEPFGLAGWLWLLSMALLLGAASVWSRILSIQPGAPAPGDRPPTTEPWQRLEVAAFVGIMALAFVLRTWDLRDFPFAIHPDEVLTGRNASAAYLSGAKTSIFSTVWLSLPALWFAGIAASLKIGGVTLAALRLPSALFGAATVIPVYLLLRLAWGRAAAIVGAAIMAFSASNVHYARVTLNNIVTPFFWTVCFYFLLRGLRTRRALDWALAGLAGGLGEYSYYGTHLLPFVLMAFVVYLLVIHWQEGRRYLGLFVVLVLGYFAAFGPLLAHFTRYPTMYFGRGTAAGVLMWNHIPRDWADLRLMWRTLWPLMAENLLAISTHSDQSSIYWAPLLMRAEAALLVLGGTLLIWRWRYPPAFLTLLWGLGVLFVGGTLVHGVPFLAHWAPGFPAFYVAVGVPIGAWLNGKRLVGSRPTNPSSALSVRSPAVRGAVLGLGVAALAWANINFYFRRYQVARPEFEIRAAQARWEAALGTGYRVRTIGRSWQDYDPELNKFLIQGQDGARLHNPAAELPMSGVPGKGLAFVFFPGNEHYRSIVRTLYPGGSAGVVRSHAGGVHFFSTYVVNPMRAQERHGVQLDVARFEDRSYRPRGRVSRVGALAPDVGGRLRARWSGALYLSVAGTYRMELAGTPAQAYFDGRPGLPPANAALQAGWHRIMVEAAISRRETPRLLLCKAGEPRQHATEVPSSQLWPESSGAGVLRTVAGVLVPRIDPFIGFTAAGDPAVIGPGLGARLPVRARWTGELQIPAEDVYTLEVRSDGAAWLSLEGRGVAAVCSKGEPVSVPVTLQLEQGWHPLQLDYVARPGQRFLELFWAREGESRSLIPPGSLRLARRTPETRAASLLPPAVPDCTPMRPPTAAIVSHESRATD
ncbi:MAG TPA: glycosyltransferase family 39 protein [Thermoanaerobaculia bacterium]